jgi:hypothetical protein
MINWVLSRDTGLGYHAIVGSRIDTCTLQVAVDHVHARFLAPMIKSSHAGLVVSGLLRIKSTCDVNYVQAIVVVVAGTNIMITPLRAGTTEVGDIVDDGRPLGSVYPVVAVAHGFEPAAISQIVTAPVTGG